MKHSIARRGVAVFAAAVMAVGLAGCALARPQDEAMPAPVVASPDPAPSAVVEPAVDPIEALDGYVESERRMIPLIFEATGDLYSDIVIDPEYPSTVVFTYTYAEPLDPEEGAMYFDSAIPDFQSLCDSAVFPAMQRAGVAETVQVVYTYLNPDGSLIWTYRFTPS
ncbi:MAG: hypothetical protein CVT64_11055 [Actinobacteria bacterium HGW-Actinobacteria-4]|nr:MAG: hypothetical protein CVT64_11055 [Actinobacteria bacterium HGW-Actinobacteria-4]